MLHESQNARLDEDRVLHAGFVEVLGKSFGTWGAPSWAGGFLRRNETW